MYHDPKQLMSSENKGVYLNINPEIVFIEWLKSSGHWNHKEEKEIQNTDGP